MVELWVCGRVWYTVKVLRIMYNLFARTETQSLSVYKPIAMQILLWVGDVPQFWVGVELGGRVCYPLEVLCSRYSSFA